MGKKRKAPVAMLPNLDIGDRVVVGESVYEFLKIKDINTDKIKLVFVYIGPVKDYYKKGTGRDSVR